MKHSNRKKSKRTDRPILPELDQTKGPSLAALLPSSRADRINVPGMNSSTGFQQLAPATINLRLAAVRRLAYEVADTGLLIPELVVFRNSVGEWGTGLPPHSENSYCQVSLFRHSGGSAMPP